MDTVETGLRAVSSAADLIPAPGGPIVKLLVGSGLTIIDILNGVSDNRDEAVALGRHVGVLVQTVVSFLEVQASGQQATVDSETEKQLHMFLEALQSVESSLKQLQTQSDVKQGVSYKSNKTDLRSWQTQVKNVFDQLQNRLSLNALRILTNMIEVDALRERDRLLGLLGDGATGVASKTNEETDIMCYPETRTVVLDDISRWLKDTSGERILWISGAAGCGKSSVTTTIPHQHKASTSSAIFYINRGTQQQNGRVICSIARQLARLGHGSLERVILEAIKAQPDIATSLLPTQFQHLLVNPLNKLVPGSPTVLILIDGLDEWENHDAASKLIELIGRAHSQLPPTVRFVIASRNEHHLVSSILTAKVSPLVKRYELDKVPSNDALHDIRVYLETRFSNIRSKSTDSIISKDDWPGEKNITVLVNLSAGLFQWASIVMKHIEQRSSEARLRRIMDTPEDFRGLDGLYRGIFNSFIHEDTPPFVLQLLPKVLGFIAMALDTVNAVTIMEYCVDPLKRVTMKDLQEDVIARLASLLVLPANPTDPIRISHKSVVDFATDSQRCTDPRFYINTDDHHGWLASMSLTLLSRDLTHAVGKISNRKASNEEAQGEEVVDRHISATLQYACQHWATHVSLASHGNSTELSELLDQFSGRGFVYWVVVMGLWGLVSKRKAALVIEKVLTWFSKCTLQAVLCPKTQILLTDMVQFLDMFERPIAERAALVYACALLAPSESQLRRRCSNLVAKGLRPVKNPRYTPTTSSFWVGTKFPEIFSMSSDGSMFASPSEDDHAVILWDAATGEQRGETLKGHTEAVSCIAFAPDGKSLASGSSDGIVRLWSIGMGPLEEQILELGQQNAVEGIAFSPNGQNVALAKKRGGFQIIGLEEIRGCVIWQEAAKRLGLEVKRQEVVEEIEEIEEVVAVRLEQGLEHAQELGQELWQKLWQDQDLKLSLKLSLRQGLVRGLDQGLEQGLPHRTRRPPRPRLRLRLPVLVPEQVAEWLAELRLERIGRGIGLRRMGLPHRPVVFAPDGTIIAHLSVGPKIQLWDLDAGVQLGLPGEDHTLLTCCTVSPKLALGDASGTVHLRDDSTGRWYSIASENQTLQHLIQDLQISADSQVVATYSNADCISIWELEGWTKGKKRQLLKGYTGPSAAAAFSYGTKMLACGHTKRIWSLDAEAGRGESALRGHASLVVCLAFSNDGQTLASGGIDGAICLWDPKNGIQTGHITSDQGGLPMALHFTEDDKKLVASHGLCDVGLGAGPGEALQSGEIHYDGWVMHGEFRWFWLPICGGE